MISCGAKASRCGSRQVRMTRVCICCVQDVTGQLAAVNDASFEAASISQGWPPTVTLFSEAVSERPWAVTVRFVPSFPVDGDVDARTGVSGREYA